MKELLRTLRAITILALSGVGCSTARSPRVERCEFGTMPLVQSRTVSAVVAQGDSYHLQDIVVTGYYRRAYEESFLWPSRSALNGRDHRTPRIDPIEVDEAEQHVPWCNGLELAVYGEFHASRELGIDVIHPKAIRVVR